MGRYGGYNLRVAAASEKPQLSGQGGQGMTRYLTGTDGRYLKIAGHSRHSHMLARPRCAEVTVIRGSSGRHITTRCWRSQLAARTPPASAIIARNGRVVLQDSPSICRAPSTPASQPRIPTHARTCKLAPLLSSSEGAPIKCHRASISKPDTTTCPAPASVGRGGQLVGQRSRGAEACRLHRLSLTHHHYK